LASVKLGIENQTAQET